MKKLNFIFCCFLLFLNHGAIEAQDTIVKNNGDEVLAKVLTISSDEVGYKNWSNLEGPVYTVSKSDILFIKYANGEKEMFEKEDVVVGKQGEHEPFVAEPSSNNDELVAAYNPDIKIVTKEKTKPASHIFPIMAMSKSSILSTDEIEVLIIPQIVFDLEGYIWHAAGSADRYFIRITNKTDKIIYIDKGNTFRVFTDNTYKSYYDNKTRVSSTGTSVGGVLGLVGVTKHSVETVAYSPERILAIPPRSTVNLSEFIQDNWKRNKYDQISDVEWWGVIMTKGFINEGQVINYSEEETPYKNTYLITYSSSETFEQVKTLSFEVYAKYILGVKYNNFAATANAFIKGVRKTIPDFFSDPGILIGNCTKLED